MAEYPTTIYDPREIENMPTHPYDADKKTVLFADDINNTNAEVLAIENALGLLGDFPSGITAGYLRSLWIKNLQTQCGIEDLSLVAGFIAPTHHDVTFADPFGDDEIKKVLCSGGYFTITEKGSPVMVYKILTNYEHRGSGVFRIHLTYVDASSGMIVGLIAIPSGATIGGDPTISYEIEYQYVPPTP